MRGTEGFTGVPPLWITSLRRDGICDRGEGSGLKAPQKQKKMRFKDIKNMRDART